MSHLFARRGGSIGVADARVTGGLAAALDLARLAIPKHLKEATKTLFGVQPGLRANLETKDASIARQLAPDALAELR
jgi:hypothetical protein